MNKCVVAMAVFAAFSVSTFAFAATGSLTVFVQDELGQPISNATVRVRTAKKTSLNELSSADYYRFEAHTDSNGVATVVFNFVTPTYYWGASAEGYYQGICGGQGQMDAIPLEPAETNRAEIAALEAKVRAGTAEAGDWLRLFEIAEPYALVGQSHTNHAVLVRKRNPKPMFCPDHPSPLPVEQYAVVTNENNVAVRQYPRVDFDVMEFEPLPPHSEFGKVSDFAISYSSVATNAHRVYFGRIEFASGCGAYIRNVPPRINPIVPVCFEADTNAVFSSVIEFSDDSPLLRKGQYMVLHTRVDMSDPDNPSPGYYSLIEGPLEVNSTIRAGKVIFNQRRGDTNLEAEKFGVYTDAELSAMAYE